MTMKIHQYSLMRDILASQQRPRAPQSVWSTAPLVVLSGFAAPGIPKEDTEHLKLTSILFQNMFPSINAATVKLSACQRVLLLEYSPETKRISLRQYSIASTPSGVTKSLKSLVAKGDVPDMGSLADVSEFLTRSGYGSESEGEDAELSRVEVSEGLRGSFGGGARQTRIRLHEIGPRMELEVIKVEEGMCDGKVLFHRYVKKSKQEAERQENEIEARRKEKERRRRQQEENVRRKRGAKELKREQSMPLRTGGDGREFVKRNKGAEGVSTGKREGTKGKQQWWEAKDPSAGDDDEHDGDDDGEWYRKEVGEMPDEDFVRQSSHRRRAGEKRRK